MRRKQTISLGDAIAEVIKLQKLDKRLYETRLLDSWQEVLGPAIANYTENKYIKNKVLYVKLSSSVLRNELMMSRSQLLEALNKKVGADVIIDIKFS